MARLPGWQIPIRVRPGQLQQGVDPLALLPARSDLVKGRLEFQRKLILTGATRYTPVLVTTEGIFFDGHHHGVRAGAEEGRTVDVRGVDQFLVPSAASILDLPVR